MARVDVIEECKVTGRGPNVFGWSEYRLTHDGQQIGWLEVGLDAAGYSFEARREDDKSVRLIIWKDEL